MFFVPDRLLAQLRPSPPPTAQLPAAEKEWETARSTAIHFDTLLMQMRTFGLPFIATAVGAGAALGTTVQRIDTSPLVLASLCIALGGAFLLSSAWIGLVAFSRLITRKRPAGDQDAMRPKVASDERLAVGFLESAALLALGASFLGWGIWIGIDQPPPFLFSAPVLILGGLLLLPVYLLDRFYYSSLLVGAVDRAEQLEGGPDKGKLTGRISQEAPNWTFKTLPMLFYVLPVLLLVNVGLATIGFAAQPTPTCEVTIKATVEQGAIRLLSEIPAEVAASCLK